VLSDVLFGSPQLFRPFVVGAHHAALYRNWHWEYVRRAERDNSINISPATQHYPPPKTRMNDEPAKDSGGNFGRLARTEVMDSYKADIFAEQISGIPLRAWLRFLKTLGGDASMDDIDIALERLAQHYVARKNQIGVRQRRDIKALLANLSTIISRETTE